MHKQYLSVDTMEPLEFEKPKRLNYDESLQEFDNNTISCQLFATMNNSNGDFSINLLTCRNPFMHLESNQTVLTLSPSFGVQSETKLVWCHPVEATVDDLRNKLTRMCGSKLDKIGCVSKRTCNYIFLTSFNRITPHFFWLIHLVHV